MGFLVLGTDQLCRFSEACSGFQTSSLLIVCSWAFLFTHLVLHLFLFKGSLLFSSVGLHIGLCYRLSICSLVFSFLSSALSVVLNATHSLCLQRLVYHIKEEKFSVFMLPHLKPYDSYLSRLLAVERKWIKPIFNRLLHYLLKRTSNLMGMG